MRIKYIVSLILICSSFAVAADPYTSNLNNFELSLNVGSQWSQAANTSVIVTQPYETDDIYVNHVSNATLLDIGFGYHFSTKNFINQKFIDDLLLQINLSRSTETTTGSVSRYQSSQFNNYNFNAPIVTEKLMLDFKPTLITYHQLSFYPTFGAGIAQNKTAYNEISSETGVDPSSVYLLNNNHHTNFAYEIGAGSRFTITKNVSASLDYLYINSGKFIPSGTSTDGSTLSTAPVFKIRSQAVTAGINFKFN